MVFKKGRLMVLVGLLVGLAACSSGPPEIDFSDVDFENSPYKHINNGPLEKDDLIPYNVDTITGATLTLEGPGVANSVPLSVRELENQNQGLVRDIYEDGEGYFIYEGLDLAYLFNEMSDGENGIVLADNADIIEFKDADREHVAYLSVEEIKEASANGRPILLAYGIGDTDEEEALPFVYDPKADEGVPLGYSEALDNDDGSLRLVYDLGDYGDNPDYKTFTNAAYIYVHAGEPPGFKHVEAGSPYDDSSYLDYFISFRGDALGKEINLTVKDLESLAGDDSEEGYPADGMAYRNWYSLANTTYWYNNEYEGLKLYELLQALGMPNAKDMGLGDARTTLVRFFAADGLAATETFSIDALSFPDNFGYYKKNSEDLDDGSYVPVAGDLVDSGYPVMLAWGVNGYPYTKGKTDDGFLSGLNNDGGPIRVVFGKRQYNHFNGSNQVKYLNHVQVGEEKYYNTHFDSDVEALQELGDTTLTINLNAEGQQENLSTTVAKVEEILYGPEIPRKTFESARVKGQFGEANAIYEGIDLEYFFMDFLKLPSKTGHVTFANDNDEYEISIEDLFNQSTDENQMAKGLIAFAKNGHPLAEDSDAGYVKELTIEGDKTLTLPVDNSGGPLQFILDGADGFVQIENLKTIRIDLQADKGMHDRSPYDEYKDLEFDLLGEGVGKSATYAVADIEALQREIGTFDYAIDGQTKRFRGLPIYDFLVNHDVKNNAGALILTNEAGDEVEISLSNLRTEETASPPILAFASGKKGDDALDVLPLVAKNNAGYEEEYQNGGGPLALVYWDKDSDSYKVFGSITSLEVTANPIDYWTHSMSEIYSEFLDVPITFTLKNETDEITRTFTVAELEAMEDFIVRENYYVLNIGEAEGLDLWALLKDIWKDVDSLDEPVSLIINAKDGYSNDLLSNFQLDGLEKGIPDENLDYKKIILAYAIKGYPLVDDENHEGYTGLAGNAFGPLRLITENTQGASIKYVDSIVITITGSDSLSE